MFMRHCGERVEVKRQHVTKLPAKVATIIDVKRTRAVVGLFDAPMRRIKTGPMGLSEQLVAERWNVPLDWLLLPGCMESDPRQLPLFAEASK